MRRGLTLIPVLFLAAQLPSAAALPGVTRTTNNVYLFENHNVAYLVWHSLDITNATVVHIDTHDDCRYIPDQTLAPLWGLTKARDYDAIYEQSDLSSSFHFKRRPDDFLFDLGNFIYPCMLDGTITNLIWVVPDRALSPTQIVRLQGHLRNVLHLPDDLAFTALDNGFSFPLAGGSMTVTTLNALPTQPPGCLLDLDIDFFSLPYALAIDHIRGGLQWDPAAVCALLDQRVPQPATVTISSSVWGGYLPIMFRFLADACYTHFATGQYPEDAVTFLKEVTRIRTSVVKTTGDASQYTNPDIGTAATYINGLLALINGDLDLALTNALAAARCEPVYAAGLLDFADALINRGLTNETDRVLDTFDALVGGETSQSLVWRARVRLSERQFEAVHTLCDRLIAWDDDAYFYLLKGGALTAQSRFYEAESIYRKIIASEPGNVAAHYNLGIVLAATRRAQAAVDAYRTALNLNPNHAATRENLGHLLLAMNQPDAAIEELQRALRLNPVNPVTMSNLGMAYAKKKESALAISWYERALALHPDTPQVEFNLASVLADEKRWAEAEPHATRALFLLPGWVQAEELLKQVRSHLPANNDR